MNHIMPGLIDDETRIENLYKDYKRFVKINSFIENFLHAPVEFMERLPINRAGNWRQSVKAASISGLRAAAPKWFCATEP